MTGLSQDYELLDSGRGLKLERFGPVTLVRPCAQAVWAPVLPAERWRAATATFTREGGLRWRGRERLPETWEISVEGMRFRLSSTDFGHLGIFPEQRPQWRRIREVCAGYERAHGRAAVVLNLFAYSGGSTLAAALGGAEVCHVDASKGMVDWARINAGLNGLGQHPVRWIVDDVMKFTEREEKRGRRYDLIILDPPSYGRGARGEVFKISTALPRLLAGLRRVWSDRPAGVLLSCHTPELTPLALRHLLGQAFGGAGRLDYGEMALEGAAGVLPVPSGSFCWLEAG